MSGLPVFILAPACPFLNTRETHLLACYKAAYWTRRQLMQIAKSLVGSAPLVLCGPRDLSSGDCDFELLIGSG